MTPRKKKLEKNIESDLAGHSGPIHQSPPARSRFSHLITTVDYHLLKQPNETMNEQGRKALPITLQVESLVQYLSFLFNFTKR
jgi:hypothetical protein